MKFQAKEFQTARGAIEYAEASGGCAIRMGGRNLVVKEVDANRLAEEGTAFTYLVDQDGEIVTIPVNEQ